MNHPVEHSPDTLSEPRTLVEIFGEYLPLKPTREERLYIGMIRQAYDASQIDLTTVIEMCKLIQPRDITINKDSERKFLTLLGLPNNNILIYQTGVVSPSIVEETVSEDDKWKEMTDSTETLLNTLHGHVSSIKKADGTNLSEEELHFLIQLSEWGLVGVFWSRAIQTLQEKVIRCVDHLTQNDIDGIKTDFWIRIQTIIAWVKQKKIILDFHKIPASIIPSLSQEVREFIFLASRKKRFMRKSEKFNSKMIDANQDKILRESLS